MKTTRTIFLLVMVLIFTACAAKPVPASLPVSAIPPATASVKETAAPIVSATPAPGGLTFKTSIGDLVYVSSRFVEEVNGVTPAKGCKLLLVVLKQPDNSKIDLQKYMDAHMQVFIRGDDGSETLSTMGGFVQGEFAIGFQVPETVKTYRLIWGDNLPIEITPQR
jgi:hypothetical protein